MEYLKLFEILHKQHVRYMLCGGLAVNIYGIPRMTADIDIILDLEKENISRFESAIKLIAYSSVIPMSITRLIDIEVKNQFIKEKKLVAYSYFNQHKNIMSLDVLIDVPLSFDELWEKRSIRNAGNFAINVVSIDHLISLKKYSNRKQDRDDILLLSQIKKDE